MGRNIREREDSISSDDSLSRSNSLSSPNQKEERNQDKKRLSSLDSLSSDGRSKHKKETKEKSSKENKKSDRKDDKNKKSKKKITKDDVLIFIKHFQKKDKKRKTKSGKDKKSKKEKKEKKSKKDSKKGPKPDMIKKKMNRFGKYGMISKVHIYEKQDEFQQWLSDVKKLKIEALGQNEEKRLFDDFIEDYNTASMPDKKYYDLALWEQYTTAKSLGKGIKKTNDDFSGLDDEAQKKLEKERQKLDYENKAIAAAVNDIYTHGNMVSDIQETLTKQQQMEIYYKTGDTEKAKELQKELVPEKKKPGQLQ